MKIIMIDALIGNDYTVCLCNGLTDKGMDVTLVAPENRQIDIPYNFKLLKWSPSKDQKRSKVAKLFTYLQYFVKLFILIKKTNSVVHYQFFRRRDEIFFFLLLKLTGTTMFYTAHNVLPHISKSGDYFIQKMVYKASTGIIAHSEFIRKKLVSEFNIPAEKIKIIPHGNFDVYLPSEEMNKTDVRKKFSLTPEDKVILFFGGIREYKGLDTLLDAFNLIKDENNYKLIIAGAAVSEDVKEHYFNKIRTITTNGKIKAFLDFVPSDQVASYFISSDVLILPYKNIYHSGLVHLAYSFSKPIIATRVGDFDEAIENYKSGLLLDENTPEDLAEKIRIYFSDPSNVECMGKYAKQLSDTKYSWSTIADQTINLYKTV